MSWFNACCRQTAFAFGVLFVVAVVPPGFAGDAGTAPLATAPAANGETGWTTVVESQAPTPTPMITDLGLQRSKLDDGDQTAALEAIQFALTQVGDGAAYVWHRKQGTLSGMVRPTASFREQGGKVCRHLIVALSVGSFTKQAEGIACRDRGGRWSLEG